MSLSAITGSSSAYSSYGSQSISGPGTQPSNAAQSSYAQTINTDSVTLLSLDQPLSGQADKTQNDLVAQGLAQAIDGATTVDPVTGQRELFGSASQGFTSAVTSLLTENGFSQEDAQAAATAIGKELSHGGKALLALGQDSSVTSGDAAILSNGSGTAAGAQLTTSQYASRLAISIDLNTGSLGVSTQSVSSFATAAEAAGTGSLANGISGSAPGSLDGATENYLSVNGSSGIEAFLDPGTTKQSPVRQLLDNLANPTIVNADTVSPAIGQLNRIARGGADAATPFPGITVNPNGTATTQVDVRVPVALRHGDGQGHGTTLYKRPDGSLAAFSLQPTNITT